MEDAKIKAFAGLVAPPQNRVVNVDMMRQGVVEKQCNPKEMLRRLFPAMNPGFVEMVFQGCGKNMEKTVEQLNQYQRNAMIMQNAQLKMHHISGSHKFNKCTSTGQSPKDSKIINVTAPNADHLPQTHANPGGKGVSNFTPYQLVPPVSYPFLPPPWYFHAASQHKMTVPHQSTVNECPLTPPTIDDMTPGSPYQDRGAVCPAISMTDPLQEEGNPQFEKHVPLEMDISDKKNSKALKFSVDAIMGKS